MKNNSPKKYELIYHPDNQYWSIKDKEFEIFVNNVIIGEPNDETTSSIEGWLTVKNGIAFITPKKPDNAIKRHIVKTITWRIIGTMDTMLLGWIITGNLKIGLTIGGVEVVTKMFLYFLHERAWFKFGKLSR